MMLAVMVILAAAIAAWVLAPLRDTADPRASRPTTRIEGGEG
jgi:FlaG/FlaF family flagellin (archaellin)